MSIIIILVLIAFAILVAWLMGVFDKEKPSEW